MKYINTLILFLIFTALVIAFAYAEGGSESLQPVFLSAVVFVQLILVITGAIYIANKSPDLTSWKYAVASFVPLSWIGAILFSLNFAIRINSGNIWSLISLGLLIGFCISVLVFRKCS